MKVNSIKTTQPRYNKTQQNTNYMTPNNSQSFGTKWPWGNSSKKVVTTALEQVKPNVSKLGGEVIDKIYSIAKVAKPESFQGFEHAPIKYLKEHINEETAPFAHSLLDQIPSEELKRNFSVTVGHISSLVKTYKVFPNSRKTMQFVVNEYAKHFKGSDKFSMMTLHNLMDELKGKDMQNRFVEKIVAAKNPDGSPRFLGKSFSTISIFHNYSTPAQEEAFNLILDKKSVVKKEVTDYKVLTSMLMDLPVEEYASKSVHAKHQVEKEKFLVNGDDDFRIILKNVNVDNLPVLKQILPRLNGEHSGIVASILENYTPMHEQILAKGLQLIDRGEMSLQELSNIINIAGGDVPFRG